MGDFNADCSYMNAGELDNLGIRQQGFEWLIGDEVDTTQGQTHCAYDRSVELCTVSRLGIILVIIGCMQGRMEYPCMCQVDSCFVEVVLLLPYEMTTPAQQ